VRRLPRLVTITLGVALGVAPSGTAALAQGGAKRQTVTKPTVDPNAPTTLQGVFTAEQADRGKDIYLALCQSCHVAVAHTGPVFRGHWAGRPLSDLYTFVSTRMPKNEPASLAPETYADLVAYILKLNQVPAGATELVSDPATLQHVRIQFAPPSKRAKR
jgi:mono/diheme cytochrome c family protein